MLVVNNIEVVFWGTILVLKGVSLRVEPGTITALIGANGAGKTTTLKAISGLIRLERGEVTRGSIEFEGRRIENRLPEEVARLGIVMVREGRRLFEELTAEENLLVGAALHPTGAREALELVYTYFPRLRERRRVRAGYLSGGEQQMLAIGRGLMARPRVLLLDEPSMGLAPVLVEQIFETIQDINRQGTTVLLVEQNVYMALTIAHRGYVLETGSIAIAGTAGELRANKRVKEAYLGA